MAVTAEALHDAYFAAADYLWRASDLLAYNRRVKLLNTVYELREFIDPYPPKNGKGM